MCGSQDVVKKDGLFICSHCNTKYSVEEARKLMVEGTVTIDHSSELENLLKAARNAREIGDDESAITYYKKISAITPDSWEAMFYLVILKTNEIKLSQIQSCAISVSNCLLKVFSLINETITNEDDKKEAIWEVIQQCQNTATWLTSASHDLYNSVTKGNKLMALTGLFGAITSGESYVTELNEDSERCTAVANIMFNCGNYISEIFDMSVADYSYFAVWSWKNALEFHTNYREVHKSQTLFDEDSVCRLTEYINQYASTALAISGDEDESPLAVLTIEFDSSAGSATQLWYSIDDGEKNKLNRKEKNPHFLELGTHTINILNPFMKKKHTFELQEAKTLKVYGKAFSIDIIS